MEFKYKIGDLITCEMKQGVYQIVGQVEFKKISKNCDPGPRYYFRSSISILLCRSFSL